MKRVFSQRVQLGARGGWEAGITAGRKRGGLSALSLPAHVTPESCYVVRHRRALCVRSSPHGRTVFDMEAEKLNAFSTRQGMLFPWEVTRSSICELFLAQAPIPVASRFTIPTHPSRTSFLGVFTLLRDVCCGTKSFERLCRVDQIPV